MKLSQCIQYLKDLHDERGDIDVTMSITYETKCVRNFEDNKYEDTVSNKFDKNNKSVAVYTELVHFD